MSPPIISSSFQFNKFALLLSKYDYKVKLYDILAGVIIGLESKHALVDIGLDKVAFLPLKEISIHIADDPNKMLNNNYIGEFLILEIDRKTEQILVSLKHVHSMCLWDRLKQINFNSTIIYAKQEQSLSKGKIFFFNDLKIFALNSHIPKYYRRQKEKTFFMPFKFIEIKDFFHIAHVNSRLAIFSKLSQNIKIGSIYCGNISAIKNFGVFINILGLQCLLHISEISHTKILDIYKLYKQGDQIKIRIIYKDIEQGKISVTLKGV
uniref:30S ribosomal protein S1 n=1 Tax=Microzonia abyssicola TaxID=217214 RepID=UPI002E77F386|nr:30S ribosomal protein S1 [Syringoderma abyssicola]WAM65084.1 30S ribosomal protein S1 [Syringoderma abyssicola]